MSFSFSFEAANHDEAKQKASQNIDNYVVTQEAHKGDAEAIRSACHNFVDSLPTPAEGEKIGLNAYGSAMAEWKDGKTGRLLSSEMTIKVRLIPKPAE